MRAAIRAGATGRIPPGWRRASCSRTWRSCPKATRSISCAICQRNPKPCPLSGVSDTGNPMMFTLGRDIDIRTDVPAYNIYRDGKLDAVGRPISRDIWQDDLVAFALGCSFTFEHALHAGRASRSGISTTTPPFRCSDPTSTRFRRVRSAARWWSACARSRRTGRPGDRDLAPVSAGPWRACSCGRSGRIGIARSRAPEWGDPAPRARRACAGVLGLRRHPAGRDRAGRPAASASPTSPVTC